MGALKGPLGANLERVACEKTAGKQIKSSIALSSGIPLGNPRMVGDRIEGGGDWVLAEHHALLMEIRHFVIVESQGLA